MGTTPARRIENTVEGWARRNNMCAPQVAARYSSDVHCLVRLDLLGRTGPARLRLRVRFGVTDDMPTLSLARSGRLDPWNGGIE